MTENGVRSLISPVTDLLHFLWCSKFAIFNSYEFMIVPHGYDISFSEVAYWFAIKIWLVAKRTTPTILQSTVENMLAGANLGRFSYFCFTFEYLIVFFFCFFVCKIKKNFGDFFSA